MNTLRPKYGLKSTIFIKVLQCDAKYDDISLCLLKQHFIMGRKLLKCESFDLYLSADWHGTTNKNFIDNYGQPNTK